MFVGGRPAEKTFSGRARFLTLVVKALLRGPRHEIPDEVPDRRPAQPDHEHVDSAADHAAAGEKAAGAADREVGQHGDRERGPCGGRPAEHDERSDRNERADRRGDPGDPPLLERRGVALPQPPPPPPPPTPGPPPAAPPFACPPAARSRLRPPRPRNDAQVGP